MNSLTGKFGQRTHESSSVIYSTEYTPSRKTEKQFDELLSRVLQFEPIFSDSGHNNAIILEIANERQNPTYPIYLSAQILAYSRVIMSRIMRAAECYTRVDRAIYYTDTDSLLMPSTCIAPLVSAGYIGKGLGQIKCDLNEDYSTPESFAKIVRGIWAATKGPYSLLYVLPNAQQKPLMEKVRVKGIPHDGAPFPHYQPLQLILTEARHRTVKAMKRWLKNPLHWDLPCGIIGSRFYLYQAKDDPLGEPYFARAINFNMIQKMMRKEGILTAVYGGMKRCFSAANGKVLLVKPDVVQRVPCSTDWWARGKRIYLEGQEDDVEELSYPPGYCIKENVVM